MRPFSPADDAAVVSASSKSIIAAGIQGGKFFKEVPTNASKDHSEMQRMQAKKLQHDEEQEERPRPSRNEEVLQVLQKAYRSYRNKVMKG